MPTAITIAQWEHALLLMMSQTIQSVGDVMTSQWLSFFDFPKRFGDLLPSTCGPFQNGRKKRCEKLETDCVAMPTI